MAHMAGNEPNFDISSKKYDVQKTVPQKYKTAWALGLKSIFEFLIFFVHHFLAHKETQKNVPSHIKEGNRSSSCHHSA